MYKNVLKFLLTITIVVFTATAQGVYFPPSNDWQKRDSKSSGFDPAKLKEAIDFAIDSDAKSPRDQELGQIISFGREPFGEAVGPFQTRGDAQV